MTSDIISIDSTDLFSQLSNVPDFWATDLNYLECDGEPTWPLVELTLFEHVNGERLTVAEVNVRPVATAEGPGEDLPTETSFRVSVSVSKPLADREYSHIFGLQASRFDSQQYFSDPLPFGEAVGFAADVAGMVGSTWEERKLVGPVA